MSCQGDRSLQISGPGALTPPASLTLWQIHVPVGYSLSKEVSCSHSNFFREEQGTWVKTWATFEWMKPLNYTLRCLWIASTAGVHRGASVCCLLGGGGGFCSHRKHWPVSPNGCVDPH